MTTIDDDIVKGFHDPMSAELSMKYMDAIISEGLVTRDSHDQLELTRKFAEKMSRAMDSIHENFNPQKDEDPYTYISLEMARQYLHVHAIEEIDVDREKELGRYAHILYILIKKRMPDSQALLNMIL